MNKQGLVDGLQALSQQDRPEAEKIFLRLLKQVWEIDWTVAPYDVWTHYIEWDVPYFLRFMRADVGDEAEENQLIIDWITSRIELQKQAKGADWKQQVFNLIEEANQLRATTRKQTGW
ncbi:MAG: hypothetical protein GDA44_04805 [Prochloron sp. SP5CPC1]|nr:hypothetical protein [Candidatus Paraprochloron terpiosi SP5CPC1]